MFIVNNSLPYAYFVANKDPKILFNSSSGGAFYSIAFYVLNDLKGVVYGACMNDGVVSHIRIIDSTEIINITKSKYSISNMGHCFSLCEQDLLNDKYVLFVGSPCQINALHGFLECKGIDKTKLICADFACHGNVPGHYLKQYLNELLDDTQHTMIDFRFKKPSWSSFSIKIDHHSMCYIRKYSNDPYMMAFLKNYILLEACYSCACKGEKRKSDITLCDFWGIRKYYPELYNKRGSSLVIIRNNQVFFENIFNKSCRLHRVSYSLSLLQNSSYHYSVRKPDNLEEVKLSIKTKGFNKTFPYSFNHKPNALAKLKQLLKKSYKFVFLKRFLPFVRKNDVAIITDYGFVNFGNKLQNFSLRYILRKLGYNCINITNSEIEKYYFYRNISSIRQRKIDRKRSRIIYCTSKKTGERYASFSYNKQRKKFISSFNNIILGSDQIWNTGYNKINIPFNLGLFGTEGFSNTNIFSYAASFGTSEIPNSFFNLFSEGFSKLSSIGVREIQGIAIAKKLGFNAYLTLDPTLLLNDVEWLNAIKHYSYAKLPNEKFILKYCLSSKFILPDIDLNLKCIDLLDRSSKYYLINQFDFINYIRCCEYLITDSFHALVFAIIFKKKIMLISRESMNSRLITLLSLIDIKFEPMKIVDLSKLNFDKLHKLKQQSLAYLKKNLV